MRLSEIYSKPRQLSMSDIRALNQIATPQVNNLIETPDQPGLFDPERASFKWQSKNGNWLDLSDSENPNKQGWTDLALRFKDRSGIYAWFKPEYGYYNIGIAAKDNLLSRTKAHIVETFRYGHEEGRDGWKVFRDKANPQLTLATDDTTAEWNKARLYNDVFRDVKVVFWVIHKPEDMDWSKFKDHLEYIESELTAKHTPLTNKQTVRTQRVINTIELIKNKLQTTTDYNELIDDIQDLSEELQYMLYQLSYAPTRDEKEILDKLREISIQDYRNLINSIKAQSITGRPLQPLQITKLLRTLENSIIKYHQETVDDKNKKLADKRANLGL